MQTSYYPNKGYSLNRYKPGIGTALTTVIGTLLICLLSSHILEGSATSWSPTETARRCFSYPEERTLPDSREIAQILLSAAFFGSDAVYFDDGEENTGSESFSDVIPSEIPNESQPTKPLDNNNQIYSDRRSLYTYDRSLLKDGESALLPYDLSGSPKSGEVLLSNTTAYNIDTVAHTNSNFPIVTSLDSHKADSPLVLILHTHGTESYVPEGSTSVPPGYVARNADTNNNMIAVGKVMAELLNSAGIPTLHCETMHDLESYNRAYDLAADTVQKYLAQYPSIKYVFDVHRDAIVRENGDYIRPLTLINGERSAQIMLLVGTNEKGADHPTWEMNMTVAAKLQSRLTTSYEAFARPINIRGASFNQQFTSGSLLIEIGSAANTLSEAKTAAKYLTYSIIDMLKENDQPMQQ